MSVCSRNQLHGKVSAVLPGSVNDEIEACDPAAPGSRRGPSGCFNNVRFVPEADVDATGLQES